MIFLTSNIYINMRYYLFTLLILLFEILIGFCNYLKIIREKTIFTLKMYLNLFKNNEFLKFKNLIMFLQKSDKQLKKMCFFFFARIEFYCEK
jgi:hypothetical protein